MNNVREKKRIWNSCGVLVLFEWTHLLQWICGGVAFFSTHTFQKIWEENLLNWNLFIYVFSSFSRFSLLSPNTGSRFWMMELLKKFEKRGRSTKLHIWWNKRRTHSLTKRKCEWRQGSAAFKSHQLTTKEHGIHFHTCSYWPGYEACTVSLYKTFPTTSFFSSPNFTTLISSPQSPPSPPLFPSSIQGTIFPQSLYSFMFHLSLHLLHMHIIFS